jgi:HEPN domain
MRWNQSRELIDGLIADGLIQRVVPSREHANRLIAQARAHLSSAARICAEDPAGGYAMTYDAARKALTAVLENQGLRPTTRGGHLAVYQAVRAQLSPPLGDILEPFDRMRRQRHEVEYPAIDAPELTGTDVREDIPKATKLIQVAAQVLDDMSPY